MAHLLKFGGNYGEPNLGNCPTGQDFGDDASGICQASAGAFTLRMGLAAPYRGGA